MAREGRVMVYNLTEAAQEFLSENRPTKSALHRQSIGNEEIALEENLTHSAREAPFEARIHSHRLMHQPEVGVADVVWELSLVCPLC